MITIHYYRSPIFMRLFKLYEQLKIMLPLSKKQIKDFLASQNLQLIQLSMLKVELNMELKLREYLLHSNQSNWQEIDKQMEAKEQLINGYKSLARSGIKININAAKIIQTIIAELITEKAKSIKSYRIKKLDY